MKKQFFKETYSKVKKAILEIDENIIDDIYALSFWFSNEDDEPHLPTIMLSFNTISNYKKNIENAYDKNEAKWNFAFWLQDFILQVGGKKDLFLHKWFKSSNYYYSEKEMENAENDDELFEELCLKGEKFCKEFIEIIIKVVKQLNEENIPLQKFGKSIPLIIHDLEYSEDVIHWNKKANSKEIIREFIEEWVESM